MPISQQGRNLSSPTGAPANHGNPAGRTQDFDPSTWEIPTKGFAAIWYHICRACSKGLRTKHADRLLYLKWQETVALAQKEYDRPCEVLRRELAARNVVNERAFKRNLVRELCNRGILPTVNVKCWKSGAKTTLTAYVGSIITEESRNNSVLLPSTANTSSGASGAVTGLKSDNFLTLTKYANILGSVTTTRELANELPKTRHGLSVVVEDSVTKFDELPFDSSKYRPILHRTYILTDGCVLQDDGNEDIKEGTVAVTAARNADVIVFSASCTQPHSLKKMVETLNMLKQDPYTGPAEDDEGPFLPGELRSTADKVKHALIVVSGVKPKDEKYDFDALRGHNVHSFGEGALPEWDGQGFTIPWDAYVFGGHNVQNVVDLDKLDIATYDAYLDVTIAILLEGARALGMEGKLHDLQTEFVAEEFVAPPEPDIPQPEYATNKTA